MGCVQTGCKLSKLSFFGPPKMWTLYGDQKSELGGNCYEITKASKTCYEKCDV